MRYALTFVAVAISTVLLAENGPRVERRKPLTANVGVVSVGLDTYWKQCPGLYEDMLKKAAEFEKRVASHQVKVSSFALGVGHHAAELKKLGCALGIETVVVTEDR